MATASSTDPLAVAEWHHGTESKSDRYLADRLAAAGADFKSVAAATFVLGAAVAAAVWLALGVLAEHWLVPGGLPVAVRWAWLVTGVAALVAATLRWAMPLVRYKVNLVYAARAIEQEHPELHNDIVNAVLVKAHAEDSTPLVVRSLERRAAKRLSVVPADGVAARDVPLRLTIALAALVAALGVYQLVAPKSLVVSAARLMAPWWGLAAPARVSIAPPRLAWRMPPDGTGGDRPARPLEVSRGTVTLVRGRQLVVETDVEGLGAGERAMLVVTPLRADGSAENAAPWQLPLAGGPKSGQLTAVLPDAARGLEQSIEFVVAAGDARTEPLRVAVVDTPTLLVREVRYDYPAYTGRKPEKVDWQGDLRAPEFTRVTITAECNRPLQAAWIDPGCSGLSSERKSMRIGQHDLSRGIVDFPLRLNAGRTGAEFTSYRLGFKLASSAGGGEPEIVEKLEHRIEVIADIAPEVSVEAPEDGLRVPPSAPVAIRVRALDPDHGLARVGLEMRVRGGGEPTTAWLLTGTHKGPFSGSKEIVPEQVGAGAGTVIEYRAVAIDTRPEAANVSYSPADSWRTLQIDAAAPPAPLDRQPPSGAGGRGDGMQAGGGERGGDPRGGEGDAGENRSERPPGEGDSAKPESQDGSAPKDGTDAKGGGARGDEERDESGDRKEQPQPRDNGGRQESGEQPEQSGQQGGESNAGASGSGAGSQPKPEQRGSGAGGKPQAGGTSDRGGDGPQGSEDGKQPGSRQDGAGEQKSGESSRDGQGDREGGGQRSGAARPQGGSAEGRGDRRSPPRNAVAADGTNDGEAMERILEDRRRQGAEQKGTQPTPGAGSEQRPGDEATTQPTDRGEQPRDAGTPKEGDAKPQSSECKGADGKPCGKEGCSTCSGGGKAGGASGAGTGQGQGQAGQGQSGQGQSGQGQSGQGQSGQGQSGEGQSGEGQAGEGQAGEGQAGEGQAGEGQAGRDAQAQKDAGQPGGSAAGASGQPGSMPGGDLPEGPQPAPGSQIGAGGRAGGDRGGSSAANAAAPARRDAEWTEQDTTHARNAADLAVEHLRDSVAAGRTDVLDQLGWTPDQARAFIDRWQAMRRLETSADARDRREFERAVRSLGLRPDGVRSSRDVPADVKGGQAEGRRSRPPAAYREQVEAFLRGAGGE